MNNGRSHHGVEIKEELMAPEDDIMLKLPSDDQAIECLNEIIKIQSQAEEVEAMNLNENSNGNGSFISTPIVIDNKINDQNIKMEPIVRSNEDLFDFLDKDLISNTNNDDDIIKEIIEGKSKKDSDEVEIVSHAIEEHLSLFDDKKPNLIDLNDRDEYIKKNFDLEIFLKSHTKLNESKSILTKASLEELFFNMENENMLYFLTVIRDRVHQLYLEFVKPVMEKVEYAHQIINKRVYVIEGHNLPREQTEQVWATFKDYFKNLAPYFVAFAKQLPGFENICQHDFTSIVDDNISVLYGFRINHLHINDEFYLTFGNVQITKRLLNEFYGASMTDSIFEFHENLSSLNLKTHEVALLIPFILTLPGNFFF